MQYKNYSNRTTYILLALILFIFLGGFNLVFLLFGLALALLFNFLPLILISSFVYLLIKSIRKNKPIEEYLHTQTIAHRHFVEILVHIMAHLIHADGKVDEREKQSILSFFQTQMKFRNIQMMWVTDILESALKTAYPLEELTTQINQEFHIETKRMLLQLLYSVALADGHLHKKEQALIDQIAKNLNLSKADQDQIKALFIKTDTTENHYKILGIPKTATQEEIKKAYRTQAKKHHPDKVAHLGEEFAKKAEEQMQKINEAYDALKE